MRKPTITDYGMGIFATKPIDYSTVTDYYFGTLVYRTPSIGSSNRPDVYREGSSAVTVKVFAK